MRTGQHAPGPGRPSGGRFQGENGAGGAPRATIPGHLPRTGRETRLVQPFPWRRSRHGGDIEVYQVGNANVVATVLPDDRLDVERPAHACNAGPSGELSVGTSRKDQFGIPHLVVTHAQDQCNLACIGGGFAETGGNSQGEGGLAGFTRVDANT